MSAEGIKQDRWVCPEWYAIMQAAKYLNVAPWELSAQPIWWVDKALIALQAEGEAREQLKARNTH